VYALAGAWPALSILDVGCGGAHNHWRLQHCTSLVGVDVPQTVEWLQQHRPSGDWRTAEWGERWQQHFDVVLMADVLEHLADPCAAMEFACAHCWGSIIASTPALELLDGSIRRPHGPPRNSAHAQEWTSQQFLEFAGQYLANSACIILRPHTTVVIGCPKP